MKIQVGQKVYLKPIGNKVRISQNIRESEIEKIGKKYFYLKGFNREKFSMEDMMNVSNYVSDWKVYLSIQEIEYEKEYNQLFENIRKTFDHWSGVNFTLDQLRRIKEIIDEN